MTAATITRAAPFQLLPLSELKLVAPYTAARWALTDSLDPSSPAVAAINYLGVWLSPWH
jgi:hypothetical protein